MIFWDNWTYELGTVAFGAGLITKYPITKKINLYTKLHFAGIPLAGNSTRLGPDNSQVRDYVYGTGFQGKFETSINFNKIAEVSLIYYNYMIYTTVGTPGTNFIQILKPRFTIRLYKDLNIGFESFTYFDNRTLKNFSAMQSVRSEQKIFLLFYFEDSQRRGNYN